MKEILSDEDILIDDVKSKPTPVEAGKDYDMIVRHGDSRDCEFFPHIDYHKMFSMVWDNLARNHCVAIFPEGGSHDQSNISSCFMIANLHSTSCRSRWAFPS